jgi:GT2 family glycosyltransferase
MTEHVVLSASAASAGDSDALTVEMPRFGAADRPTLTVIICAYTTERWPDLVAAVESVRAQQVPADEILVVIDHCDELGIRASRELAGVRVLPNAHTRGLSGARNTGVEAASGQVVAFLDDDARAEPGWTAGLLAEYRDPAVLGVGGLVEPAWLAGRPGWFPEEFLWVVGCSYRGLPEERARVRNFIGANMSLRRDALDRTGGFREDLGRVGRHPAGCEETELCIRVARTREDARMLHEPAAKVRHSVPAERATWAYFRRRCYAEGVSKAAVTQYVGSDAALSSERAYVSSVIPAGILRALARGRIATALALVAGVLLTALGYLRGRMDLGRARLAAMPPRARAAALTAAGAPALALALWLVSLRRINPGRMTDLGLISVLPAWYWAAAGVLTLGFSIAVRDRSRGPRLLLVYIVLLILMIHGTPTLVYSTLRYAWAWKHLAIIDYFMVHGAADPSGGELSAYYQWPGFFTLNALILHVTGLKSAMSYAAWAPPVFNLAMIAPLLRIFRYATSDRRVVWTGLFVFFCASWIGQDYFSPQAFAFVLYLVIVAVVLKRIGDDRPHPVARWLPLLLLPIATIASSHQLTPIMLLSASAALALPRKARRYALWLLLAAAVMLVAWDTTVAWPFVGKNLSSFLSALGSLDTNAGSGVVGLGDASSGQVIVSYFDRGLTGAIWLLALWAVFRRTRLNRVRMLLLMLAPLPAAAANSYGGEMIYRVYMFSLPGAALLAAASLIPRARRRSSATAVLLPGALGVLLTALLFSYYGKEQMNYFTPQEVAAADYLTTKAPAGSLMISELPYYPAAYQNYERYSRDWLLDEDASAVGQQAAVADPIGVIRSAATGWDGGPAYFIITSSELAEIRMEGDLTPAALDRLLNGLTPANGFDAVYRNADAAVYRVYIDPSAIPTGGGK